MGPTFTPGQDLFVIQSCWDKENQFCQWDDGGILSTFHCLNTGLTLNSMWPTEIRHHAFYVCTYFFFEIEHEVGYVEQSDRISEELEGEKI